MASKSKNRQLLAEGCIEDLTAFPDIMLESGPDKLPKWVPSVVKQAFLSYVQNHKEAEDWRRTPVLSVPAVDMCKTTSTLAAFKTNASYEELLQCVKVDLDLKKVGMCLKFNLKELAVG